MPLFDYKCKKCGLVQERFSSIEDRPEVLTCRDSKCKGKATRVFLPGHGGIQCDSEADVKWLKSAEQVIKPEWEKPWDSRKDYRECLKRNNLQPAR